VISGHIGKWVDMTGRHRSKYTRIKGRNNMRSVKRKKELAGARQCPEKDSMALWSGEDWKCCN
jgi:hypothetical protein